MPSRAERMRETLQRIAAPETAEPRPYDQVFEEFAGLLNENPAVQVEIETRDHPPMRFLVTRPKHRRTPQASMLSFALAGRHIKVLGEGKPELRTPEELWDYLEDFVNQSDFRFTLKEYEELEKEEVEGHLRTTSLFDMTREDILVAVPPAQQVRLAKATPGEKLTLTARPEQFPGFGTYADTATYGYLESAGYGLRVAEHRPAEDGMIEITGTVMAPDDTR